MVKYIGSKRALVPIIEELARRLPVRTACDVFAGTTRVGQALRRAGLTVHSNDLASYSEAFGHAYIAAGEQVDRARLRRLIDHLSALPPERGYFTETFSHASRFFQTHNGMRVDAIRAGIDRLALTAVERGLLLSSLLEAADRVDSTCGLQMAYVKQWAPRSYNDLQLREPAAVPGPCGTVSRLDALDLAAELDGVGLAYLDPPYNQHSYFSNYHIWETLVRWDAPAFYGVACKRVDCRSTSSAFNRKRNAGPALSALIEALPTPWIVVSLSDEGFHDPAAVAALLGERGYVGTIEVDSRRYVGAQIGVYNPRGQRVGEVSHLRNRESLIVCGPDRARVDAAVS